jgi:uncharacterized tellurite resistance protein B-like protein
VFLNLLDPAQQALFLELARAVTEQDGLLADSEEALLAAVQAECMMDEAPAVRELDAVLEDVASSFDAGPARAVLILELAGVALIDGEAHPAETGVVATVADRIDMSPGRLQECFAFADRARTLIVDGQALIATADEVS